MKFSDLTKHFQSRWKEASVARRTQRAVDRYRNSGEVKYPRIYGYRQTLDGVEVVPDEAKVIRIAFGLLAMGKTLDGIKQDLDKRGIRNRSGNRFTSDEIKAMAMKPIYAGLILGKNGRLIQSKHYEPIASREIWQKAQKALKKVSEGADYRPPVIGDRVLLTLAEGRRCSNTNLGIRGLF